VSIELLLDFGDMFGKSGDLLSQFRVLIVEDLQPDGALNVGKHYLVFDSEFNKRAGNAGKYAMAPEPPGKGK
jgi:hypothetical protein